MIRHSNKCSNTFLGIVCCILSATSSAAPDEGKPRYNENEPGRVFMSSAQRRSLDRQRHSRPANVAATAPSTETGAESASTDASRPAGAGYILPSNGHAYQWIKGEFKKTKLEDVAAVSKPYDITIVRHKQAPVDTKQSGAADPDAKPEDSVVARPKSDHGQ